MNNTSTNASGERIAGPDSGPVVTAELLDIKAVASLLGGCSRRHIYRLSDAGRMPRPIKLGNLVRWRLVELQAWIDAGCPTPQNGGQRR